MAVTSPFAITSMLFDLDGTLVDTAADFAAVLDEMTMAAGIAPVSAAAVHQTVSNGARALVELAFGINESDPRFKDLHAKLLALYGERIPQTRSTLYPGMDQLLSNLEKHSIPWGVVTNKPEQFSTPLLRSLGLLERCQTLICPEHVTFTKPHPEPLLLACRQLGCEPSASVYVGDHPRDISAGQQAGMYTIAAAYGYLPASPPVADWGADMIVTHVDAITAWLNPADRKH
ncbi:MAG: HAD-IA family hydrolase [Pseudomonadota bacterium]